MPTLVRILTPIDAAQCYPELIGCNQLLQMLARARSDIKAAPSPEEAPPPYEYHRAEDQTELLTAVKQLKEDTAALKARADARDVEDRECREDRADLRKRIEELERRIWTHQTFVKHKKYENLDYPEPSHYDYSDTIAPGVPQAGHKLDYSDLLADTTQSPPFPYDGLRKPKAQLPDV